MNLNQKLIISGFAFLLSGVIAALSQSNVTYILGGLGLFFVLLGCFATQEKNEEEK